MLSAIVLGLAQGIRHSFEPDHLAAVSALVGQTRGARRSAWLGAIWGFGHTISLCLVGLCVLAFDASLPDESERWFQLAVGALLIVLGARAALPQDFAGSPRSVRTPVQAAVVGMVHGLAGSSALTALVVAALPTFASRIAYLGLFGFGSIAGMAAVSSVAGIGLGRVRDKWLACVRLPIGIMSIIIGIRTLVAGWSGI
jgi:hypothetical protein